MKFSPLFAAALAVAVLSGGCASQRGTEQAFAAAWAELSALKAQNARQDERLGRLEQCRVAFEGATSSLRAEGDEHAKIEQQTRATAQIAVEGAFVGAKLTAAGKAAAEKIARRLIVEDALNVTIIGVATSECPAVSTGKGAKAKKACEASNIRLTRERADAVGAVLQEDFAGEIGYGRRLNEERPGFIVKWTPGPELRTIAAGMR